MLHTKYQGSRPFGFRLEDFFMVPLYVSLCKTFDPVVGPFLAKYQESRTWFQTSRFFQCVSLYKAM